MIYLDYAAPVDAIRRKVEEIARASPLWDGKVVNVAVTDFRQREMELRILVSAGNAAKTFDLRCEMREKLIDWLRREHPDVLPRTRAEIDTSEAHRLPGARELPRARESVSVVR